MAYLERFPEAAKQQLEAGRGGAGAATAAAMAAEVKLPGANRPWVPKVSPEGMRVLQAASLQSASGR